jgi:hypothetical protein
MMSKNIARNVYGSQETINYSTQLHLVGHFVKKKNCIMMHGSMNVKFINRCNHNNNSSSSVEPKFVEKIVGFTICPATPCQLQRYVPAATRNLCR